MLSDVVASQNEVHARYGGVVPELASRDHIRRVLPLTRRVLAEAQVTKAKGDVQAEVTESQAEAEASGIKDRELATAAGIEARGLAEAKAIQQKAEAMKLLHAAGKEHEEFKLRLAKDRDVALAELGVARFEAALRQRTRVLAEVQEELIRKERLATLGQLTATVSHELRNPQGRGESGRQLNRKHL